MKVVVIDGQGGGIGKSLVAAIKKASPNCELVAVGTNSAATSAMLKAGAESAATGESAVIYNCRGAQYVAGAIGIGFAGSMFGEISPAMAAAVAESPAKKLLIPMSDCGVLVAGVVEKPVSQYVEELAARIAAES